MAFPWLTNAKQWCETGLTIMERELALQIYPDGVIKEQAVAYLTFVLDFNLIVWQLAQRTGHPVPDIWPERLGSACEFILYLIDKQGNVPAIGDDDDGWVLRLDDQTNANNYRSLLHSAAVILHRPEFKTGLWDEKSQWLLGENGRSTYNAFPVTRHPLTSRHFPNGGYIIMRHADTVITFDCGPLGYLATAAHGHADALSLTMNVDGQPILIDPGTYAYQEGYGWRDYFRSTSAHNTVVVDGRNQSEIQGSFLWGQQAHTTIRHWQTTPEYDFAIAEHDGYSKIGITHRRSVLFLKSSWLMVVDDLLGKGQHHINQLWHLHPNCHITVTTENIKVDINNTPKVFVHVSEMETAVIIGQQNPPQGWASSHYGHLEPAPVITASSQCYLPQRVMTVFCLANSDVNNIAHVQAQFVRLENEVNL
jgi:hypothetical protein